MNIAFFQFAVFLFFWNVSPGPIMAIISRNAAKHGFKAGFAVIIGVLCCDLIYLILAFIGVSEFIAQNNKLFEYAKIIGASYIFYIGLSIILNSYKNKFYDERDKIQERFSYKKEISKGFLTNLSDPFTIVGMTSFILPFFRPEMLLNEKLLFLFLVPFTTIYSFSFVAFAFGNQVIRNFILPKMMWFEIFAGIMICFKAGMVFLQSKIFYL